MTVIVDGLLTEESKLVFGLEGAEGNVRSRRTLYEGFYAGTTDPAAIDSLDKIRISPEPDGDIIPSIAESHVIVDELPPGTAVVVLRHGDRQIWTRPYGTSTVLAPGWDDFDTWAWEEPDVDTFVAAFSADGDLLGSNGLTQRNQIDSIDDVRLSVPPAADD